MASYILSRSSNTKGQRRSTFISQQEDHFSSATEGKVYFCGKILGRYVVDSINANYFDQMGDFLSRYSPKEKCYIIGAYAASVSDLYKWLHKTDEYYSRSNLEILGEQSLSKVYKTCKKLLASVQNKIVGTYYDTALLPNICCEVQNKFKSTDEQPFYCIEQGESYLGVMPRIGCLSNEDVCDKGGHSYFKADE